MRPIDRDDLDFQAPVTRMTTGFPSPAEDHIEGQLDLNELLIRHPSASFYMEMESDAMAASGIHKGDVIMVDRSLAPVSGSVVVAAFHGEFLVRRYKPTARGYLLLADDDDAPSVRVNERVECEIWGVVTYAIHQVQP